MSEPEKSTQDEVKTPIQRASERKRAYRIRQKPQSERTDADNEWFAQYEATKKRRGVIPTEATETEATDEPEATEPVVDAPPPPPPPRIDTSSGTGGDSKTNEVPSTSNWRAKYQRGGGKASGREQTVLFVASQWQAVNKFLYDQIRLSGATPWVDFNLLFNSLVLTVDEFMPERVAIKPAHIAAFGTTALLVQRVVRHKKVGEAIDRGLTMKDVEPEKPEPVAQTMPPAPSVPAPEQPAPVVVPIVDTPATEPMKPVINLAPAAAVEYTPGPNEVF